MRLAPGVGQCMARGTEGFQHWPVNTPAEWRRTTKRYNVSVIQQNIDLYMQTIDMKNWILIDRFSYQILADTWVGLEWT